MLGISDDLLIDFFEVGKKCSSVTITSYYARLLVAVGAYVFVRLHKLQDNTIFDFILMSVVILLRLKLKYHK